MRMPKVALLIGLAFALCGGAGEADAVVRRSVTIFPGLPTPGDRVRFHIVVITGMGRAFLFQPTHVTLSGNDITIDLFIDTGLLTIIDSVEETVRIGKLDLGEYSYTININTPTESPEDSFGDTFTVVPRSVFRCQARQLSMAARLCSDEFTCLARSVKKGGAIEMDSANERCFSRAESKFESSYERVLAKTARQRESCALDDAADTFLASLFSDQIVSLSQDIDEGRNPANKSDSQLRGSLIQAAGKMCAKCLAVEKGRNALKQESARLKCLDTFESKATKTLAKAARAGIEYTGLATEQIANQVDEVVDSFVDLSSGEAAAVCRGALCGDGVCEGDENFCNCPGDCPLGPTCDADCVGVCGNGFCENECSAGSESHENCPQDCPCPPDTGACGRTVCPIGTICCDPLFEICAAPGEVCTV